MSVNLLCWSRGLAVCFSCHCYTVLVYQDRNCTSYSFTSLIWANGNKMTAIICIYIYIWYHESRQHLFCFFSFLVFPLLFSLSFLHIPALLAVLPLALLNCLLVHPLYSVCSIKNHLGNDRIQLHSGHHLNIILQHNYALFVIMSVT